MHFISRDAAVQKDTTDPPDARVMRDRMIVELAKQGYQQRWIAEAMGVSTRTVKRRWAEYHPDGIPYPNVVLMGANPFHTPEIEATEPNACRKCGGRDGVIQDGDSVVCIGCLRTGYDDAIEDAQRFDATRQRLNRERAEAERRAAVEERRQAKLRRGNRMA